MADKTAPLSRVTLASPSGQQHHPHLRSVHPTSSSYVINPQPPPPLLDVATPVRFLIWQYMDDRSAIRYLSTCRSLHRIYHSYPLKRSLRIKKFSRAHYMHGRRRWYTLWLARLVGRLCHSTLPRLGCCDRDGIDGDSRLSVFGTKLGPVPRVIKVKGTVWSSLLPYLKHIVEADVADDDSLPIGPYNTLPRSLRTLRLHDSPNLTLKLNTLPPRLTALTLGRLKRGAQLEAGVLPLSLTSLHLTGDFNTRSPIVAGVLPPTLRRLEVDEWKLPLSDLAMPASIVHLRLHILNSDTIHPGTLPPHLEELRLEGFFDQPHPIGADVLPSSLRVLHLMGCYSQPFTYRTFARVQQLEELWLSHHFTHPLRPHMLPSSLRVLRLGVLWQPVSTGALPAHLERLVVGWPDSDVDFLTLAYLVPYSSRPKDLSIEVDAR